MARLVQVHTAYPLPQGPFKHFTFINGLLGDCRPVGGLPVEKFINIFLGNSPVLENGKLRMQSREHEQKCHTR